MNQKSIYIGGKEANFEDKSIKGEFVAFEGESYFKIANSDSMRPFFMSIVSDSNHWMFISSNGGLTAGRKDSDTALFPYYTDDKITESSEITGSKTIIQVIENDHMILWEPFSNKYPGIYNLQRNLYKNTLGNKIVFEEINQDLGLTFRYQWNSSNKYGFVKKAKLINNNQKSISVKILDGIQNIIPYGVNEDLQAKKSNLVDAYKRSEIIAQTGVGIYALSAIIVDRAEPSEALKATIAWSAGVDTPTYLASSTQLDNFRKGKSLIQETDIKAEKGAYFISFDLTLSSQNEKGWMLVANVNQSIVGISKISNDLKNKDVDIIKNVEDDILVGCQKLIELNSAADALQLSSDKRRNTRHFANTLFNIMRGGIIDYNYQIEKNDFAKYLLTANKSVHNSHQNVLLDLSELTNLNELRQISNNSTDADFKRLVNEYLPLKFSRRHGDPSRPWNKFSINTASEIDGSKILDYQGNWRDIFQNWEALAISYPDFLENMINKFLNATTFDGYNPYRVTKDGFDWEVVEHDDPWSFIGYWGDHQIIYLLKFLEALENHQPQKLAEYFTQNIYVYANVPYKIKSYDDILKDPKDTILFDDDANKNIEDLRLEMGSDGALLLDNQNGIYHVNLIEKLLATVLAKISNFIPEGGIWLNTQRPEWNDANNALVGNGVSMVTLYYMRRFFKFFENILDNYEESGFEISAELFDYFQRVHQALEKYKHLLSDKISDKDRKKILDGLAYPSSEYRTAIYKNGFKGKRENLSNKELKEFLKISNNYLEHSIKANKRKDSLYHAYNLMTLKNDTEISISYLQVMLEGQVAVLSSGYLKAEESLELLDALKDSALYRPDQSSYLLYPNKNLPGFCEKNIIPEVKVLGSDLARKLIADNNNQIIVKDSDGNYHFNGSFNNSNSLKNAIDSLPLKYSPLVEKDKEYLFEIFEDTFDHKSFTGRSGTFFGYEGLGSIYWHMVSKLALSVQEACLSAVNNGADISVIERLEAHYHEINEGIGVHKSPKIYGAFPTDPYSHTPFTKGAQQPGMTGQVKEDILTRFGELGVFVKNGIIKFNPRLLQKEEFLDKPAVFKYYDVNNVAREIHLKENSLCFTYCQVPVVYTIANHESIAVILNNGNNVHFEQLVLDSKISKMIFARTGEVEKIILSLQK